MSRAVRLSLASKIFLGFITVLALAVLLAVMSIRESRALGRELKIIRDGHVKLARLEELLDTHSQHRARDLQKGLEEADPSKRNTAYRILTNYFPEVVIDAIESMRIICNQQLIDAAPPRRRFYKEILTRLDRIQQVHEKMGELTERLPQADTEEARAALLPEVKRLEKRLDVETFSLNSLINDELNRAVKRAETDEINAVRGVLVLTGIALVIGLLLTALAARSLAPITKLVTYARAISRGDYEQTVTIRGDYELSALGEELQQMARSRKDREQELDRQADELEAAYRRVEELKRYHESVVQSLRTGVVVTDRTLSVTSINRPAANHWNLSDAKGKPMTELALGQALQDRSESLSQLMQRAASETFQAVPLGERLADITVAPLRDEGGQVLGLVVALEDVTEAIETKEALIRSERMAAIGRMSAHVTHEIRNPLAAIGLNAELLEGLATGEVEDAEEAASICSAIGREVDRLTAITEEYLRLARLPRPVLSQHDVGRMLRAIVAFVGPDCRAAGVSLEAELEEEPLMAALDPDQIRQTLLNLIRNAKESMPEGGAITVSARLEERTLLLCVRDQGGGIPTDVVDRIFDPFYSTKQTGTGLGLALCQQIVQEHGGQIRVNSEPGEGSEFVVALPLVQPSKITTLLETPGPAPVG